MTENEKINAVLQAVAESTEYPWKVTSIVKVPGTYEIYALGTKCDVTILAWIHNDGSVFLHCKCW